MAEWKHFQDKYYNMDTVKFMRDGGTHTTMEYVDGTIEINIPAPVGFWLSDCPSYDWWISAERQKTEETIAQEQYQEFRSILDLLPMYDQQIVISRLHASQSMSEQLEILKGYVNSRG